MAIEALYPSRRQSQRSNPLFARERRLHRIGLIVGVGTCVIGFLGVRSGLSGTAEAMGLDNSAIHNSLALPTSGNHVRVIPLFKIPAETAAINLSPNQAAER